MDASSGLGARLLVKAGYKGSGGLGREENGDLLCVSDRYSERDITSRAGIGYVSSADSFQLQELSWHRNIHQHQLDDEAAGPKTASLNEDVVLAYGQSTIRYRREIELAKDRLENLSSAQLRSGRKAADTARLIDKEFFQNRAALKLAEIDAMTGYLLTGPPLQLPCDHRSWHVLDICGGPGGFTEYFGTRLGWRATLHGITLRNTSNDWALHKCNSSAQLQTFRPYYGPDGSGDIVNIENATTIARQVTCASGDDGVRVVVADGGFDVNGNEAAQERLSVPLLAAQALIALRVIARGGHFVCKLFDTFEYETQCILWVLSRCFEAFAICKPLLSRAANSERYVVCRSFTHDSFASKMADRVLNVAIATPFKLEHDEQLVAAFRADVTFHQYLHRSIAQIAEAQLYALDHFSRNCAVPATPREEFLRACGLHRPNLYLETCEVGVRDRALVEVIQSELYGLSRWTKDDDHDAVSLDIHDISLDLDLGTLKLVTMWFHGAHHMGDYDVQSKQFRRYQTPAQYACYCSPGSVITAFRYQNKLYCYDAWALPGVASMHKLPLSDRRNLLRLWVNGCCSTDVLFLNSRTYNNTQTSRPSLLLTAGPRPSRLHALLT